MTGEFRVRAMSPSDLAVVDRLLRDFQAEGAWPSAGIHPATRAAVNSGRASGGRVFVAEELAGGLVGFASTWFAWDLGDGPGSWLSDLYVVPTCRRRGVGRSLIAAAAAAGRADGAVWMMWHADRANAAALAFYSSLGAQARPTHIVMSLTGTEFERNAFGAGRSGAAER